MVGGYPVTLDLSDQGRGFSKQLLEKGIGNDAKCPPDKCRASQILSQQVTIEIEVARPGMRERARTISSMQAKDVNADMLITRSIFLAMNVIRGGR